MTRRLEFLTSGLVVVTVVDLTVFTFKSRRRGIQGDLILETHTSGVE